MRQKGFVHLVLLLVLGMVLVSGYWLYRQGYLIPNTATNNNGATTITPINVNIQTATSPTGSPAPTISLPSGWEVYGGPGVTFAYPTDLFKSFGGFGHYVRLSTNEASADMQDADGILLQVSEENKYEGNGEPYTRFQELFALKVGQTKGVETVLTKENSNGIKKLTTYYQVPASESGPEQYSYFAYFDKDDGPFIRLDFNAVNKQVLTKNKTVFDQIAKSIKFAY